MVDTGPYDVLYLRKSNVAIVCQEGNKYNNLMIVTRLQADNKVVTTL